MPPKPKKSRSSTARKKKNPAPRERDLRQAAFECIDLAAAGERLGLPDLQAVLDRSKRRAAAWERGRLLRRIRDVAANTLIVPEAADRQLELAKGALATLLAKDRIVRELWRDARFEAVMKVQRMILVKAGEGDAQCLKAYERAIEQPQAAGGAVDFAHLTQTQLVEATGFPRQTLLRWEEEKGLPRSGDGAYSLPRFIEWHGKFERDKITGGKEAAGLNPMQAEKARMYRLQADESEGRLIDRPTVIRQWRERGARMVQLLNEARAEEWSHAHEGKTAGQLKDLYLAAFRRIWTIWEDFPAEVPMPAEARAKIEEGLQILMKEGAADEHR